MPGPNDRERRDGQTVVVASSYYNPNGGQALRIHEYMGQTTRGRVSQIRDSKELLDSLYCAGSESA